MRLGRRMASRPGQPVRSFQQNRQGEHNLLAGFVFGLQPPNRSAIIRGRYIPGGERKLPALGEGTLPFPARTRGHEVQKGNRQARESPDDSLLSLGRDC